MNKITLTGFAVATPELTTTKAGDKEMATFNMGVVYGKRPDGQNDSYFVSVVLFGNVAKGAANSIAKGDMVIVDGKLKIEKYKTKTGGTSFSAKVFANEVYKVDRQKYTSKEQYTDHNNEPDDIPFVGDDEFF